MKKIIVLILFTSSFICYSQTINKTIKGIDLGNLTVNFRMEVDSKSDTSYRLTYCWSNEKYSSIDDVQCQIHYTNSEIKDMIETLNKCKGYIGKDIDYNISNVGFDFVVYHFDNKVRLSREEKYVRLTKSQIAKLTSFLSKVKFS